MSFVAKKKSQKNVTEAFKSPYHRLEFFSEFVDDILYIYI